MLSLKNVSKSSTRFFSSLHSLTAAPPPPSSTFAESIKAWFKSSHNYLFDRIFEVLSKEQEKEKHAQFLLSQLGTRVTESLVLEVLSYGNTRKKDVLSCLKFFDWAGHQRGFFHTRATYHAIFTILKKAKLKSIALEFLGSFRKQRIWHNKIRFYDTLVIGYSVSGEPRFALKFLGQMRFLGVDLDSYGYHVLLNALVEGSLFDIAHMVVRQIRIKGFECDVTHAIRVKCFCRQGSWNEAEVFLRRVIAENGVGAGHGYGLSIVVDALCKNKMFEKARILIEEFKSLGVDTNPVYGIWLRDLAQEGMADEALEFLKSKQHSEGYVPEVSQYNVLLFRLLREKRFMEAWNVIEDMKESQIFPDDVTMKAVCSLFCKAGMMDVVLEILNSGAEYDRSWHSIAYNHLIGTLCEYKHIDEAFKAYMILSEDGYFPDRRTFHVLVSGLCQRGKIDIVMQLIDAAQEWNIIPKFSTYNKLIEALCRDGSLQRNVCFIQRDCKRLLVGANRNFFLKLIYCLVYLNDGKTAFDRLVEMQEKGFMAIPGSARAEFRNPCSNENVERQLLDMLGIEDDETQNQNGTLSRIEFLNLLIRGAGHAKKPKLARAMFKMIEANGLQPDLNSYIFMLQSYLRNGEIFDALDFFNTLPGKMKRNKLYSTMIVGICRFHNIEQARDSVELALAYFIEALSNGIVPSTECYEELVKVLCMTKQYDRVLYLLDDIQSFKKNVTPFIGNTLLLESLKSGEIYRRWIQSRAAQEKSSSELSKLMQLMGEFSGCFTPVRRIDEFDEELEKCFRPDVFTYNVLLTKFSISDMDHAWWLLNRLRRRGLEPNQRTYEILVQALLQHGRTGEAKKWFDEMRNRGGGQRDVPKTLRRNGDHSTPRYS